MNEETTEQPKELSRLDTIGDLEMMQELIGFFGVLRASELYGWAVIAGFYALLQTGGNIPTLRRSMEERGMTKSTMYRALADARRFGEYIEGHPYPRHNHEPTMRVLRRLSTVQSA